MTLKFVCFHVCNGEIDGPFTRGELPCSVAGQLHQSVIYHLLNFHLVQAQLLGPGEEDLLKYSEPLSNLSLLEPGLFMTMGLLDGDSRGGSRSSSPTRAARRLTRRYLLFAAVLISVCTCFFMFRDTAYEGFKHTKASLSHYAGSGPEDISASDTKSSSELAWEPSEDWDPTLPIYDDFER